MNWISVKDRLPVTDGIYETRSAYYEEGKTMKFVKNTNMYPCDSNVWFADKNSPTSSVTHWRLKN